jgi:hypothetical protein
VLKSVVKCGGFGGQLARSWHGEWALALRLETGFLDRLSGNSINNFDLRPPTPFKTSPYPATLGTAFTCWLEQPILTKN